MKETIMTINLNNAASMRAKVMLLTGYTDDQMNAMIFNFAVAYMKSLGMNEDWLTLFLREPIFWTWWRQQWLLIDEVFWHKYAGNQGREDAQNALRNRYDKLHMSIDKFPDDIIYEKIHSSYEAAGQAILHKITSKNDNL